MVQRIVDDIRAALDHDLYFAALSTALTLIVFIHIRLRGL